MHMEDPLSRTFLPCAKQVSGDKGAVWSDTDMSSPTEIEPENVDMIVFVPIWQLTLLEIKSAMEVDAELQALATMIKQGWPESKPYVPLKLQEYFPFRGELSIQQGVVFEGERIMVPSTLTQSMIDKVGAGHLGVQGVSGELEKPSTGQAFTSKLQSSSQGAAFETATNKNSRENR